MTQSATQPPPPPGLKAVARGSAANLVGALVLAANTFLLTVLVTHGLDQSSAGILFAAVSIFVIATSLGQLGTVAALVYFIARARTLGTPWQIRVYYRVARTPVLVTTVGLAAVLLVTAPEIGRMIAPQHVAQATGCIRIMAAFVPVACLEMITLAATRGFGTMRPTVVAEQLVRPVLQVLLVAGALLVGAGSVPVALMWVVGYGLAALMAVSSWRSLSGGTPPAPEPEPSAGGELQSPARTFWRFAAPRALASAAQTGIQRVDIVIVAALAGPAQAALYTAATRFLVLGQMGANAISNAVQPRLASALGREDHEEAQRYYRTATAWLLLLAWPVYLGFLNFDAVILRVFGSSYTGGADVLTVLALAMLFATACGMVDVVLLMAGKSTWSLVNVLIALTVQISLDFILVPKIGILGAALGWAAAIVVNNVLPLSQIFIALRLHPFGRAGATAMLLAVGCFGVLGAGIRLVLGTNLTSAVVALLLGSGLYVLGLFLLRGPLELEMLKSIARPRRREGAEKQGPQNLDQQPHKHAKRDVKKVVFWS